MRHVDQRGFDNQQRPSDAAFVDAATACALLEIKRQTLYAYVSRGLVRSVAAASPAGTRLYARDDLERLRARHDARSGHGPVAAGALRWGEPVLESALTELTAAGPRYRGHDALALAARGVPFEAVFELLVDDTPPPAAARATASATGAPAPWPRPLPLPDAPRLVPPGTPPLHTLAAVAPLLALHTRRAPPLGPAAERDRARALVRTLAAALALGHSAARVRAARAAPRVAAAAARALGARGPAAERALEAVLTLCADHELNASAFTARVAASAGAPLEACVAAALQTMTGPLHGAASERVEALLDAARTPADLPALLAARHARGEALPGFGHPLYPAPAGDPRARALLALARRLPSPPRARLVRALVAAVARAGGEPPNLDVGLVAVTAAIGLPRGSAAGLFALGRTAGWLAHALEQRAQGFLLRPRARYVGRAS